MPAYFNVADFIKIGVFSVLFVLLLNFALKKAGLEDFVA